MYLVFKRRGSRFELLPESPLFAKLDDAIQWASDFFREHVALFEHGLEAIEVRRVDIASA
jgi:hypothetical protein